MPNAGITVNEKYFSIAIKYLFWPLLFAWHSNERFFKTGWLSTLWLQTQYPKGELSTVGTKDVRLSPNYNLTVKCVHCLEPCL